MLEAVGLALFISCSSKTPGKHQLQVLAPGGVLSRGDCTHRGSQGERHGDSWQLRMTEQGGRWGPRKVGASLWPAVLRWTRGGLCGVWCRGVGRQPIAHREGLDGCCEQIHG